MTDKTILFLHGFASSAQSTKARYFEERFATLPRVEYRAVDFNPTQKDFEYMTTTGQIDRLRQYVLDHDLRRFSIIGSSYGGLIALHYAHRFGGGHRFGGVEKMLLLAPALHWLSGGLSAEQLEQWRQAGVVPVFHYAFEEELPIRYDLEVDGQRYLEPIPPPTPMTIIHGDADNVVPTDDSRRYAAAYPDRVRLVEVAADHDLNAHLDLIWNHVQAFLLS
jgi:pimeloyl-ACP methyl ester carboxylesterase